MVLLKGAQVSFCAHKVTIMETDSEKPCTTNSCASNNSFIKETTFPPWNVWRVGPNHSNKNCFCKIILRAFILFTLTKELWRQWPLSFDFRSYVTTPVFTDGFFYIHHKVQGNAWMRWDLSLSFLKFRLWPCTSSYTEEIDFISLSCRVSANSEQGTSILFGLISSDEAHLAQTDWSAGSGLKNPQESTTATKSWNFVVLTGTFCSAKDQVLLWDLPGPWLGQLLCSSIFTSLEHVVLTPCVLSHSLISMKFKLSRKTWKSTLILINSARNKPGYQEFKPHTAQMNAAAYNMQQGCVFPLCKGWMLKKKKRVKKCIYLKHFAL